MKSIALVLILAVAIKGFQIIGVARNRFRPLYENFGLDFAQDPDIVTPKALLGEVAYQSLVRKTNPDGLIVKQYDIIERTRELKLLSLLADSGLIEVLEKKGLSLSKIEKLLPLADEFKLLEFAVKNKQLILSLAPLLIEPAPFLLPVAISVLRTSPTTFTSSGLALLGLGVFEIVGDNSFLGFTAILLGLPLTVTGYLLGLLNFENIPEPKSVVESVSTAEVPTVKVNRPVVAARKISSIPVVAARKVSATPVVGAKSSPTPVVVTKKASPSPVVVAKKASPPPVAVATKASTSPVAVATKASTSPVVVAKKTSPPPVAVATKASPSPVVVAKKASPPPAVIATKASPTPVPVAPIAKTVAPVVLPAKAIPPPVAQPVKKDSSATIVKTASVVKTSSKSNENSGTTRRRKVVKIN